MDKAERILSKSIKQAEGRSSDKHEMPNRRQEKKKCFDLLADVLSFVCR
jgi:hypothetical protein